MRFESGFELIGRLPAFAPEVVRLSLNVHRCTPDEARAAGDPILAAFAAALPAAWAGERVYIRSKLAWLRRGWLPGPPHWHCDQVARGADGEDDYRDGRVPGRHSVAAVVGDCSLTQFACGPVSLPDYRPGAPVRALVDAHIEAGVATGALATRALPEGVVALFGEGDFHRATPATHEGWRVILRATRYAVEPAAAGDGFAWRTVHNAYEPEGAEAVARYAPYR